LTDEEQVRRIFTADMNMFEIYNKEGVLLERLNVDTLVGFGIAFRIFGNRLFIIDTMTKMCVLEYKIVDN